MEEELGNVLEKVFNSMEERHFQHFVSHVIILPITRHTKAGQYRPTSETPLKWRFAGGPTVARDWMLAVCIVPVEFNLRDIKQ